MTTSHHQFNLISTHLQFLHSIEFTTRKMDSHKVERQITISIERGIMVDVAITTTPSLILHSTSSNEWWYNPAHKSNKISLWWLNLANFTPHCHVLSMEPINIQTTEMPSNNLADLQWHLYEVFVTRRSLNQAKLSASTKRFVNMLTQMKPRPATSIRSVFTEAWWSMPLLLFQLNVNHLDQCQKQMLLCL